MSWLYLVLWWAAWMVMGWVVAYAVSSLLVKEMENYLRELFPRLFDENKEK